MIFTPMVYYLVVKIFYEKKIKSLPWCVHFIKLLILKESLMQLAIEKH